MKRSGEIQKVQFNRLRKSENKGKECYDEAVKAQRLIDARSFGFETGHASQCSTDLTDEAVQLMRDLLKEADMTPGTKEQWTELSSNFNARRSESMLERSGEQLLRSINSLCATRKPTGDPDVPEEVDRAKCLTRGMFATQEIVNDESDSNNERNNDENDDRGKDRNNDECNDGNSESNDSVGDEKITEGNGVGRQVNAAPTTTDGPGEELRESRGLEVPTAKVTEASSNTIPSEGSTTRSRIREASTSRGSSSGRIT
ncbi:hypothetical protein PsorP6_007562 [Peronosclerospora sorghi]|uniref:Uncharacterized protein n=1 Tax=Peronosclerospora sorghi TaxID=230839 RepID=A0ACC0WD27_9STRA|nr:hypothetical protein PsorP6_007562 [Peronosclerospora sorghi]